MSFLPAVAHGEFTVEYDDVRFGIESPIEQSHRHVRIGLPAGFSPTIAIAVAELLSPVPCVCAH